MPTSTTGGALYFEAGIDPQKLYDEIAKINAQLKGLADNTVVQGERMDEVMRNFGTAMAGYFSVTALVGFGKEVINVRGEFQQLAIAFETMLGSKERADALMAQAVEFAQKTPFTLTDVAANIKQLMAMGVGVDDVMGTMKALGDVASGVSVPLERVAVNYGQVLTLGKLEGRELRDFAMAGIPLMEELAKNLGKSKSEIQNMVSAGSIGFKDVERAFQTMSGAGGKFNNLMEKQMSSVTGQISNLQDKIDLMMNSIGKSNEGIIYGGIEGLGVLVDHYKEIIGVLEIIALSYGTYKAALIATTLVQKASAAYTFVAEYLAMGNAVGFATANQIAFNGAILANPYAIALAGIVAITAAIITFSEKERTSQEVSDSLNKSIASLNTGTKDIDALIGNYETLSVNTNRTEAENRKLSETMNAIAKTVAGAATSFDNYGNALGINIEKAKNYSESIKEAYRISIKADLEAKKKEVDGLDNQIEEKRKIFQDGNVTRTVSTGGSGMYGMGSLATIQAKATEKEIQDAANAATLLAKQREDAIKLISTGELALAGLEKKTTQETAKGYQTVADKIKEIDSNIVDLTSKRNNLAATDKQGLEKINKQLDDLEKLKKEIEGKGAKPKTDKKDYQAQLRKEQLDRERAAVDMESAITKAKIDAMDDGLDKVLAQNQFNYEKEVEQIKRQKQDALTKLQQQEKTLWESSGGKGKFKPTITTLSTEENDKFDNASAQAQQTKTSQDQKAAEASLKQYQTYAERRIALIKEYNQKTQDVLAAGGTVENVQEVEKQMNDALSTLDMSQDKKTSIITRMFTDMSNRSVEEINKLIVQTAEFIHFLTNPEGYNSADGSFFKVTQEEYNRLTSDPEKLKAYTDQLQKLKETAARLTPTMARLGEDWKQLNSAFKNAQDKPGDFSTQLSAMQGDVNNVTAGIDLLAGAFANLGEATGSDTLKNVGSTLKDIGEVANKTMSGAMTGAAVGGPVGAIVGASIGLISSVAGIFAKAQEEREKLKAQIKKDQETEFFGEIQINEEYRKRYEWARKIGEETLSYIKREGEELKKQTVDNAADQRTLWDKLMSTQYNASEQFQSTGLFGWGKGKIIQEWATLAGKTYSDIEKLAAQGKLSAEGQKYFEALQKAKQEGQDLEKQQVEYLESLRETYTGSTYDSIVNSIIDGFRNGKRTAEDFAATFEDLMNKAVVQSLKLFSEDGIRKWYESFASMSSDSDGLTADDKAKLKQTWNDLVNNLSSQAKSLEDITGTSLTAPVTSASAIEATKTSGLTGEITRTITEATGSELAGLLRKMSDDGRLNRDYTKMAVNHLALIEANTFRTANNTDRLENIEIGIIEISRNTKPALTTRDLGG